MIRTAFLFLMLFYCFLPLKALGEPLKCQTEFTEKATDDERYKPLKPVSIFSVISDPEEFHGERISVVGRLKVYQDRIAIYPTKEHLSHGDISSSFWGHMPRCATLEDRERLTNWEGQFVQVNGVFNSKLKNWSVGTLEHVELIQLWQTGR
ncbi:hypothetical protein J2T60_000268 [Natronospira proteinivora]|uniref:Uncharacterized protein n=1 Tax=Natronospira proteinivora TaxID=1807133 RepID=A0ABT1G7G7_9GAMM|nr:hypothetical protein [Natronospira proteinivora]MCP1726303.1 hypothetical protein [Natronospira proteinivora]